MTEDAIDYAEFLREIHEVTKILQGTFFHHAGSGSFAIRNHGGVFQYIIIINHLFDRLLFSREKKLCFLH